MRQTDPKDTISVYLHSCNTMSVLLSLEITATERIYQLAANGERIEPSLDAITLINILNQFAYTDNNGWECNHHDVSEPVTEGMSFTTSDLSFTISFKARRQYQLQVPDIDDITHTPSLQEILPVPVRESIEPPSETIDDDILKKLEQEYYDLMLKRQTMSEQNQSVIPVFVDSNVKHMDPFALAQHLKMQNIQEMVEGHLSINDVEKHLPDTIPDHLFKDMPTDNVLNFFIDPSELPSSQHLLSEIVLQEHLRPTLGSRMSLISPQKTKDN